MPQKPKKHKDNKYLDIIRQKTCLVCASPAEPHHINGLIYERAMGSKNDYLAVPLCRECHVDVEMKPKTFWKQNSVNPYAIVIRQLINYIEDLRAEK